VVFDYEGVKRVLSEYETFSSRHGPAEWLAFMDPPRQAKLRALISRAFTPRMVANLEPRIRRLATELLEPLMPDWPDGCRHRLRRSAANDRNLPTAGDTRFGSPADSSAGAISSST
jgi:cytochrome P450